MKHQRHFLSFFIIFLFALISLFGETVFENRFSDWQLPSEAVIRESMLEIIVPQKVQYKAARLKLPIDSVAGRMIRLSGEISGENILPGNEKYHGGKVMLSLHYGKGREWQGIDVPYGSFEWKKFEKLCYLKPELTRGELQVGFQNSAGILRIRNFKLEVVATPLDWRQAANMALVDEVAGDGQGGWSDQGKENDGRGFGKFFWRKEFGGVPFQLLPKGKSVLTMNSKKFLSGPTEVMISVSANTPAENLYLLHTSCWGGVDGKPAGSIVIVGDTGKKQEIELMTGRDIRDWWRPKQLPNGFVAARAQTVKGENVGLYLSKFPLASALGRPVSVTFRSAGENLIWIIAGATLVNDDIKLPLEKPYVITPGKEWLPLLRPAQNLRAAGSALDVSHYQPSEKVGTYGRVIINGDSKFVFEKAPDKPLRFFTAAFGRSNIVSRQNVDIYVNELRKNGYNMVRTHFLDLFLMSGAKHDLEFNEQYLDAFDYLIFMMKENGIYLNFDAMSSWNGYSPGNIWVMKDRNRKKNSIYFDSSARENWSKGVEKILCRVNPYTKTRLIDDPVLVMTVGFNEQEFGFLRAFDEELVAPFWREFLKEKYQDIANLKAAWGERAANISDFKEIPCFKNSDMTNNDVALFLRKTETEMMSWYKQQLQAMGYRGWLSNYNMVKSRHYDVIRSHGDFVAMNHYHAHPTNRVMISQQSSIGTGGKIFRELAGTRQINKPFVVTEHNHVFWNRYRYEQSFVTGAYAAFQDFDALTAHGNQLSTNEVKEITAFQLYADPIAMASEFLTFFAYARGDVAKAGANRVVIPINPEEVYQSAANRGGLPSSRTNIALLTGFGIVVSDHEVKLSPGNVMMTPGGNARIFTDASGFSTTVNEKSSDSTEIVLLKERGLLPAANRSNGWNLFESSTGELLMDTNRNFMSVNTPRFQGICGEAGSTATLTDFEVKSISTRGNLSLVAVDGMKPIREAERMVLVYATNVLNNGMTFESGEMNNYLKIGGSPSLLQAGRFTVVIHNKNAAKLKLYPLGLAGNRIKEIKPVSFENSSAVFSIDTAKDGPCIFFEISI